MAAVALLHNPRMGFPQPTYFGRNRYWLLSDLLVGGGVCCTREGRRIPAIIPA
jgi:hypothetical protein